MCNGQDLGRKDGMTRVVQESIMKILLQRCEPGYRKPTAGGELPWGWWCQRAVTTLLTEDGEEVEEVDSKRRREIRLELELSAWTVWEELQPAVGEERHCLWLWTGALAQGAGDTHTLPLSPSVYCSPLGVSHPWTLLGASAEPCWCSMPWGTKQGGEGWRRDLGWARWRKSSTMY